MAYPETATRGGKTGMLKQLFYSGPSIEVLHEEYAKKGRIDEEAPVEAFHEVRIEAPVERVWELLSDVPGWGTWYPDVHDVHLDSGVKADARFTWTNGKARIKSTFAVVDEEREITWTGVSWGRRPSTGTSWSPSTTAVRRACSARSRWPAPCWCCSSTARS
jgi:Polyketide cyclase / dehydrase and lipid transport